MLEARLLFVALENRKVYVGWAAFLPMPETRRDGTNEHFGLLPVRSGYLDDKTLHPNFTSQYGRIYARILSPEPDPETEDLDTTDFVILLPLDKVMVVRPYSLDVEQEQFLIPQQDDPQETTH